MHKHERNTSPAVSSSSDFEFSVTNHNMMAADELFSRGKLLPFKDNCNNNRFQKMTLRDELLIEDNDNAASSRPPKSNSWKERLGLKRSNKGSSRLANVSKSSQEVLRDGDSSCRDVGEM
ncbi:hypothetical protein GIB67_010809 [Kingdonia uniflora]|uniref:Uncharacterized protein n=1 Tax=Kingdonia uniflora TaxID=39325 RepID=A0A7J7L913_9MAGN|nr:hypothetical protein GIB67_010809 [Kingdonia uniflora]